MMEHTYTRVDEDSVHVVVCNDCGAYAATKEAIAHYSSCKPGEAKRWEKYYEKSDEARIQKA